MTTPRDPILEPPVRRWECKHCNTRDTTRELQPHTRFHTCPGLGGISAPMVQEGDRNRLLVRKIAREDYEGDDKNKVQRDEEGTPIMAVETLHDDGRVDRAVLATVVDVRMKVG